MDYAQIGKVARAITGKTDGRADAAQQVWGAKDDASIDAIIFLNWG